ncbi:MAG: DNA-binding domain-containing protein, partial [Rhodanobacteraceae bacterium]
HVLHGDPTVAPWVDGARGIPAADRLLVYSEAYLLRLTEVLENDFTGVLAWLGTEAFAAHARAYIAAHPSSHPSVRWFGRDFADFLRAQVPDQPLLAELAEFEWAKGEAFDAADRASVTVEAMAEVPVDDWPGMCFVLHPGVRQLRLDANVPAIWSAITADPPEAAPGLAHASTEWLLWRRNLDVHWRSLDSAEAGALRSAAAGADFAQICTRLHSDSDIAEDIAPLHVAGMLKRWLTDGLVSALEHDDVD